MEVRVEHYDAEAEYERRVRAREYLRVLLGEPLGELLHHPVDLLRLPGEPEPGEVVSYRLVELHPPEVHPVDVRV